MKYLLTIDPGVSTGIALCEYSDTESILPVEGWQFEGGAESVHRWALRENLNFTDGVTVVAERFITYGIEGGAKYTSDDVEPLRCEGVLCSLGLMPWDYSDKRWQNSSVQYFGLPGKDAAEKKSNRTKWLQERGIDKTGSDLDAPNSDDYRSALGHAFAWALRTYHMPTLERYFQ